MGAKTLGLIALEKRNAEGWKWSIDRSQEQVRRVRVLCRAMVYAGEGLDEDDREILSALLDEILQDVGGRLGSLTRFFSDIERVGLNSITVKKREAA